MRPRPATLDEVVAALRGGGLACFPTETLWSLSCRADLPAAVRAVFAAKKRPTGVPLSVGFTSWDEARACVAVTPGAEALARRFLPGPLSIVLRRTAAHLAHVAPGLGTLSVRVPDHPAALEVLRRCGPLVVTSANRHGEADPQTTADVLDALADPEPAGDLPVLDESDVPGIGSTVVDARGEAPIVLREGVIPTAEVKRAWP